VQVPSGDRCRAFFDIGLDVPAARWSRSGIAVGLPCLCDAITLVHRRLASSAWAAKARPIASEPTRTAERGRDAVLSGVTLKALIQCSRTAILLAKTHDGTKGGEESGTLTPSSAPTPGYGDASEILPAREAGMVATIAMVNVTLGRDGRMKDSPRSAGPAPGAVAAGQSAKQ